MSEFAPYEQVKQLDPAGHCWTARKASETEAKYVIKLRRGAGGEAAANNLRTSADLQKGMSKTPGWAPIYQVSKLPPGGFYYVTDYYPWTLQRAFERKERVTPEQLMHVMDQIGHAAIEVGSLFGRGHGNLKLSNVLLTIPNLSGAKVFLCDPAPPLSAVLEDATGDRRAMGRMIYELVCGAAYQDYFYPIRADKHWEGLGETGAKWLDWTNRLLAPSATPNALTVEQFCRELETVRPAKKTGGKLPMKAIAAAVAAVALAGGAFWFMQKRGTVAMAPDRSTPPAQTQPSPQQSPQTPPQPSVASTPTPAPAPTPAPQPAPAPTPAPVVQSPPAAPAVDPQVAAQIQAAQQSAQADLDKETDSFGAFAVQMHDLAPDLHDFEPDATAARNVAIPPATRVADVSTNKQAAIQKIHDIRKQAVTAALAKAGKTSFTHPALNEGFGAWQKTGASDADPEKSLLKFAAVIHTLKQVDAAYPPDAKLGSPADPRLAGLYASSVKSAVTNLVQAVSDKPSDEPVAVSTFTAQASTFRATAERVAEQNQAATEANKQLQSAAFPPDKSAWEKLQTRLTAAGPPVAGWPDEGAAGALAKVNLVLDALQTSDVVTLQKYADAGGPPALLTAVCVRWPGVHGDMDVDATIYQDLQKGLGQVPPTVTKALGDLWMDLAQTETNPVHITHLLDLAAKANLPVSAAQLGRAYANARTDDLKRRFVGDLSQQQQSDAVDAFARQTEPLAADQSPADAPLKAAIASINSQLKASLNPPPRAELTADFRKASATSDDLLYTPPFDADHPMRFKKLQNKTTGNTFYLCTTEVSVGWMIGIVDDPHKIVTLRKLMDLTIPSKLCGPCAWRTDFIKGGMGLNPDATWLPFNNHRWDDDTSKFVPAGNGPSNQSPAQYVSPLAALYVAHLIGARLPTADEMQTAMSAGPRDNDENVSGGNWQSLRSSISGLNPPANSAATLAKLKLEVNITSDGSRPPFAGPVHFQYNDVLWFRDVPGNAGNFRDMNGNVSEWVMSTDKNAPEPRFDSDDPITVVDENGSHTITNQDDPSLSAFYKHVLRTGLSSTSGKSDNSAPAAPVDPRATHHHQFYDVGFRLALDDPDAPSVPALAAVIDALKPIAQ